MEKKKQNEGIVEVKLNIKFKILIQRTEYLNILNKPKMRINITFLTQRYKMIILVYFIECP